MYLLYGSKLSLFTRKLEAALQFYGVPFEFRDKRQSSEWMEIQTRAGTHQVPVLVTPENWPLADTTPIIDLLDLRYPARRLFPDGALGVLTHIVEDYLDEWTPRVMVHYRWHYPESALFASNLIGAGNEHMRNISGHGGHALAGRPARRPHFINARWKKNTVACSMQPIDSRDLVLLAFGATQHNPGPQRDGLRRLAPRRQQSQLISLRIAQNQCRKHPSSHHHPQNCRYRQSLA